MISRIIRGAAMRATPPSLRMSEGTRSSAITEQAPASSAILACSAFVTSMITPPFSISASPTFTRHKLLLISSILFPLLNSISARLLRRCCTESRRINLHEFAAASRQNGARRIPNLALPHP